MKRLTWLCAGILLGWLSGAVWATWYARHHPVVQLHVIAMPSATIERMCPARPPRVWLPFRTLRRAHVVPQCGEPTISRNHVLRPNWKQFSRAAHKEAVSAAEKTNLQMPLGPNLEASPPGIWPVPFEDYPGADAAPMKRCKKHHKCKPVTVSFGRAPVALLGALFSGAAVAGRRRRAL